MGWGNIPPRHTLVTRRPAAAIRRAALSGRAEEALAESAGLAPLWELFSAHGSLRVVAAVAEILGLAAENCLPRPMLGLTGADRTVVETVVTALSLGK